MPTSSFPVPPLRDAALQSTMDHLSNTYNIKNKPTTAALLNEHCLIVIKALLLVEVLLRSEV